MRNSLSPSLLTLVPIVGALLSSPGRADGPADPLTETTTLVAPRDPERFELSAVPAVGYNSDAGFGFGVVASMARYSGSVYPYLWRLRVKGFAVVRPGDDGAEFPYHDDYVEFDLPTRRGVRTVTRIGFTQEIASWFGLGNRSPQGHGGRSTQFLRRYPGASVGLRLNLPVPRLYVNLFAAFNYNFIEVYDGSKLERDASGRSGADVAETVRGTNHHALGTVRAGLLWDGRDHETEPTLGMYHELALRAGVGDGGHLAVGAANGTLRFYVPLVPDRLTLAMRFMGDVVFGKPPFYELLFLGDESLVRGVPWRRFHGRIRLLANVELRAQLVHFTIAKVPFTFGVVAFVDSGRVFADYQANPTLDGRGAGLKLGTGGGLRLRWGDGFIIRFDTAWSPDGVGYYVAIDHIF